MSDTDGILLEAMNDSMQAIAEAVSLLAQDMTEVKSQVARIPQMADNIEAIKVVIRGHTKQLERIEQTLETNGMSVGA